jgi:long-chain acyl-CoA synthetase
VVNVNPLYTPRELEHQLNDSGAETIVILENFASVLEDVIKRTKVKNVIIASIGDMLGFPKRLLVNFVVRNIKKMVPAWNMPGHIRFNDALAAGAAQRFTPVEIGHEDIAFLQYTGGTTGISKGAMLVHRNIIANMLQAGAWVKPVAREGQEIIVTALPLYHIFADREPDDLYRAGRTERADHQPARHSGLHQGNQEIPRHRHHRGQHPVQCPAE